MFPSEIHIDHIYQGEFYKLYFKHKKNVSDAQLELFDKKVMEMIPDGQEVEKKYCTTANGNSVTYKFDRNMYRDVYLEIFQAHVYIGNNVWFDVCDGNATITKGNKMILKINWGDDLPENYKNWREAVEQSVKDGFEKEDPFATAEIDFMPILHKFGDQEYVFFVANKSDEEDEEIVDIDVKDVAISLGSDIIGGVIYCTFLEMFDGKFAISNY